MTMVLHPERDAERERSIAVGNGRRTESRRESRFVAVAPGEFPDVLLRSRDRLQTFCGHALRTFLLADALVRGDCELWWTHSWLARSREASSPGRCRNGRPGR